MTVQVPVRIQTGAPVRIDGKEFSAGPVISGGRVFYDKEAGSQIVLSEIAQMRMALALRLRDAAPFNKLSASKRENLRIDLGTFTPEERRTGLIRALFVRKLDKVEPALHRSKKKVISAVIEKVCKVWKLHDDDRPSQRQVRAWYRIFVAAGRDIRALVPCNWAKGRRGPRYQKWQRDLLHDLINEKLVNHNPASFETVRLLANSRLKRAAAERGEEPSFPREKQTGVGTKLISRMLRERDKFEVMVETRNIREARRLAQSVQLGPQGDNVNHHWEVDHCLLDILVIDEDTKEIIGRPWLTAIIDRYSRCIVGFSLSFAPPSWASVMDALRIAIQPKDWILKALGGFANPWPCFSAPRHLTTDHGRDFKSNSMTQAGVALGFELHQAPPKKPWFKGKIERWFKTLQEQIVHTLPGTVLAKWENRKFFQAEDYAVLTIEEVNWIVAKWVIDIYHQDRHGKLGCTPAQMWERGLKDIPLLQQLPEDLIVPMMGLVIPRALRHGGIRYMGLRWDDEDWGLVRALLPDSANVQVRIDPMDLTYAYVFDEKAKKWVRGKLVEPVEARGRSLDAWVTIVRLSKRIAEDEQASREEALAKAFEEIDDYVAARIEDRLKGGAPKRFASFRKRTAWSRIQADKVTEDYKPPASHRVGLDYVQPKEPETAPFEEPPRSAPDEDVSPAQSSNNEESGSLAKKAARRRKRLTADEEVARDEAKWHAAQETAREVAKEAAEAVVIAPDPAPTQWQPEQPAPDASAAQTPPNKLGAEESEAKRPNRKRRAKKTAAETKPPPSPAVEASTANAPPQDDANDEDDDGDDVMPVGYGRD